MTDLNTDVRYIKGIGEKKAQALNKLGVFSLRDLVSFFPRKYEDRSSVKPIALTCEGESVCVEAMVADTPRLTRVRRGLDIVKLRAVDDSGVLDITYFNMPYAKDNLQRGETYIFFGKIETERPAPRHGQPRLRESGGGEARHRAHHPRVPRGGGTEPARHAPGRAPGAGRLPRGAAGYPAPRGAGAQSACPDGLCL